MNILTLGAAAVAAASLPMPALAGSLDGHWQVKVLGTGVLPDGKIDQVNTDLIGLPTGSQTKTNDNIIPTLAIEYHATPNLSVETICCLTQHRVNGAGALAGARIVDHVLILPATVTLKYHLNAGPVSPYIGVGPSPLWRVRCMKRRGGSSRHALPAIATGCDQAASLSLARCSA